MKKSDAGQSPSSTSGPADALKYKGVRKRKWGKWVSEIRLPNSRDRIWLGSYDSPLKAARAFDAAQFCLRGRSANFNFPDNPPEITRTRSMTPSEIQAAAARFANMVVDEPAENRQHTVETTTAEESMTSYSPSISDGATTSTAQMESEVTGVEKSFYEQLNLTANFGSDNFGLDFGFFNGFDEFGPGNFYSPVPADLDCGYDGEDCYDASIYQGSFLWNF